MLNDFVLSEIRRLDEVARMEFWRDTCYDAILDWHDTYGYETVWEPPAGRDAGGAETIETAAWEVSGHDPAAADGAAVGISEAIETLQKYHEALTPRGIPGQGGPPPISGPIAIPLITKRGKH